MANFNQAHKDVLDRLLLKNASVHAGRMFGFPAYYAGRKLCICLYEQGVGVKVPEQTAVRLLETDPNVVPFRPLGRPKMREWIQINPPRPEDLRRYRAVFDEAIQHVLRLQERGKP